VVFHASENCMKKALFPANLSKKLIIRHQMDGQKTSGFFRQIR